MASTYQRSIDVGACKPAIPTAELRKIPEPRCVSAHHTGSGGSARWACTPPRKAADGRLQVPALTTAAQRLHQPNAGVHSANLNVHPRELRLEVGSLVGCDFDAAPDR